MNNGILLCFWNALTAGQKLGSRDRQLWRVFVHEWLHPLVTLREILRVDNGTDLDSLSKSFLLHLKLYFFTYKL